MSDEPSEFEATVRERLGELSKFAPATLGPDELRVRPRTGAIGDPVRSRSPRVVLVGSLAVATALGAVALYVGTRSPRQEVATTDAPPLREFVLPGCTLAAKGGAGAASTRGPEAHGWTTSESGEWLRDRLTEAGFRDPVDVGSAFVIAHGIDGVVYAWVGPADDYGPLPAGSGDGVVTAPINPLQPSAGGLYREPQVMSVAAGKVRLWVLLHPRTLHEEENFGPLPAVVPCLPNDAGVRHWLEGLADVAEDGPFVGVPPASAGVFAVEAVVSDGRDDPSDRYLGRVLSVLPDIWHSDDGAAFLVTTLPAAESDSNVLVGETGPIAGETGPSRVRSAAGGIEVVAYAPMGQPPVSLNERQTSVLALLTQQMDADPFLGQPWAE